MVRELQDAKQAVDEQLGTAAVQLFTGGAALSGHVSDAGEASEDEDAPSSGDDSSDWDSEDDSETDLKPQATHPRTRRRAVFTDLARKEQDEATAGEQVEESDSGDSQSEDDDEAERDAGDEREAGEDDAGNTARWRSNMLRKQSALFSVRAGDLKRMVYGQKAVYDASIQQDAELRAAAAGVGMLSGGGEQDSDEDDDELFQLKRANGLEQGGAAQHASVQATSASFDGVDSPYVSMLGPADAQARWQSGAAPEVELLRHRFVTGGAEAFADAHRRSQAEGAGDYADAEEDAVLGDFEDMETGERFGGDPAALCCAASALLCCTALPASSASRLHRAMPMHANECRGQ
jgi:ribosome biogenesis protein BMS1